jgi:hypothetical protein
LCLTSFGEPDNGMFGGRAPVWFAFGDTRPLKRPLPDGMLRIVAYGTKEDGGVGAAVPVGHPL